MGTDRLHRAAIALPTSKCMRWPQHPKGHLLGLSCVSCSGNSCGKGARAAARTEGSGCIPRGTAALQSMTLAVPPRGVRKARKASEGKALVMAREENQHHETHQRTLGLP